MEIPAVIDFHVNGYFIRAIVADPVWKENCYLVTCPYTGDQALIDPGDNAELIIECIEANGTPQLKQILFTHGHFDHVGAVEALSKRYALPGLIHQADVRLLRQAPLYAVRYGNKGIATIRSFASLENNAELSLGGRLVTVLHTPGHTAGSVCYALEGFVFTGDTLLNGFVGRTDQPGGNEEDILVSIETLLTGLPGDTILFPGHGKHWTITDARTWWQEVGALLPKHDSFIH